MSRSAAGQRLALVRARLSLPTVRKAAGLFEGAHTSILTGKGHDFEDLAEYSPGDEVRDIDWKVSARAYAPRPSPTWAPSAAIAWGSCSATRPESSASPHGTG